MDQILIKIENEWYDLTEFSLKHPGGRDILHDFHEKDATEIFKRIHGENQPIQDYLKRFRTEYNVSK